MHVDKNGEKSYHPSRLIKRGNTWNCIECDFSYVGNPELLAYYVDTDPYLLQALISRYLPVVNELKLEAVVTGKCPECSSTKFKYDSKHDENTCLECGLTVAGPPGYVGGDLKLNYPWSYNFQVAVEMHNYKKDIHVLGFYYPPRNPVDVQIQSSAISRIGMRKVTSDDYDEKNMKPGRKKPWTVKRKVKPKKDSDYTKVEQDIIFDARIKRMNSKKI
jgi:ribosomal protein L37AE/L43A